MSNVVNAALLQKTLVLDLKAFSLNAWYGLTLQRKSLEAHRWSWSVFKILNNEDNQKKLRELRDFFDPKKHTYKLKIDFYFPEKILITQKNTLSSRTPDLTNIEKPLVDLIFLPKYFQKKSPYGVKNLNIDDKYILEILSKKNIGEEHKIEIKITIQETILNRSN